MFNLIYLFFIILIAYFITCVLLLHTAEKENKITQAYLEANSPELITVFTGDSGRIALALEMAKKYQNAQVLITGVYKKTTLASILKNSGEENSPHINPDNFQIDYLARNTIENVFYTIRHLRSNPEINKIVIISSDYHILRIKQILDKLRPKNDELEIYFLSKHTKLNSFRSYKILFKEVYKIIKAQAFLTIWQDDWEEGTMNGNGSL